LVRIVFIIHL